MKTATLAVAVITVIAVALSMAYVYGWFGTSPGPSTAAVQSQNASCNSFAGSQYAQYAYLISGDTLSPDAQNALSGFQVARTQNPDGTIQMYLVTTVSTYVNQTYTLKPGQKLYFIEMSLGDDHLNRDSSLADDTAIVVDPNGCIVG